MHEHTWVAVSGFCGRYRCTSCQCFGYKPQYVVGYGTEEIVPYKCSKCGEFAVTKQRKQSWRGASPKKWYCGNCRPDKISKKT